MGGMPSIPFRNGVNQKFAYTATAASSAAFGAQTYAIRIMTSSNCWYLVGQSPTANTTGNGVYLPSGTVECIRVAPGEKISVVADSSGGNASITELTF